MLGLVLGVGAFLVLADWFDAWVAKRSIHVGWGEEAPRKWILWGTLGNNRFFLLRLPSWDWGWDFVCDREGFGQRVLVWTRGNGWRVWLDFN